MKSLLLVDDDPAILDSLRILLGASYRVSTARDGEEGLRVLEREPVDLVVLDMLLPLVDGEAMLREVRRRGSRVPILVVSAHAERLEEAALLGANDFLLKPFDVFKLEEKIERLLGSGLPSRDPGREVQNLRDLTPRRGTDLARRSFGGSTMNDKAKKGIDPHPDANRDPLSGEPGSHPVGAGVGAAGGAVAGAAAGGAVGGPLGAAIGGVAGAVVGAAAGRAAGEALDPTVEERFWKDTFTTRPYYQSGKSFSDYRPAYRYGWESASRPDYRERRFEEVESDLERGWEKARGESRQKWYEIKDAAKDAWYRIRR